MEFRWNSKQTFLQVFPLYFGEGKHKHMKLYTRYGGFRAGTKLFFNFREGYKNFVTYERVRGKINETTLLQIK